MCKHCTEDGEFRFGETNVLLADGIAIAYTEMPESLIGPEAYGPFTILGVSGTQTGSGDELLQGTVIDLNGTAQLLAQLEWHVSLLDPEERTKFTHLYDQQKCRIRDTFEAGKEPD